MTKQHMFRVLVKAADLSHLLLMTLSSLLLTFRQLLLLHVLDLHHGLVVRVQVSRVHDKFLRVADECLVVISWTGSEPRRRLGTKAQQSGLDDDRPVSGLTLD